MATNMGIGLLGDANIIFKRKFRWTFEVQNICSGGSGSSLIVPPDFVKVASRPKLTIDEVEINFLNATTWIPGKGKWQTITVTYLDVFLDSSVQSRNGNPNVLFTWLRSVYDFADPVELKMGSKRRAYAARGVLNLYDGCGTVLETWQLEDMWPTDINFGDVAYDSNDPCEIELTLRYSGVKYIPNLSCGLPIPNPCCKPCGS